MSTMTTNGSAKNDRQLLVVLPIALVVGIAYVAWGATFPTTAQVTVCEKIVSTSVTEKSVKLLTGDTLKVDRAIYDELEPLTTYVVEERWFREPVFKAKADGAAQEGNRCWNVP